MLYTRCLRRLNKPLVIVNTYTPQAGQYGVCNAPVHYTGSRLPCLGCVKLVCILQASSWTTGQDHDIALTTGQYHDISLATVQYHIIIYTLVVL